LIGRKHAKAHDGLCRSSHSNFAFLIELESEYGDDALVEYWDAMKLANFSSAEGGAQSSNCFREHLVEFYQSRLEMVSSKVPSE
jgi:hypothetical protein